MFKKAWTTKFPAAVNLIFQGAIRDERLPLYHLPLDVSQPLLYNLTPTTIAPNDIGSTTLFFEPVMDEIYQNQRFDPLNATWVTPFMISDPPEMTDSSGKERTKEEVKLPDETWCWQGAWEVDISGKVGVELEETGWYYNTSFTALERPSSIVNLSVSQ